MRTRIDLHRGIPTFFIDDQPHDGIFSSAPVKYMRNVLDAGFDVVDTHPYMHLGWVGPNQYDYTETDRRIESYLEQSSTAKLILRFWVDCRQEEGGLYDALWWAEHYPENRVCLSSGEKSAKRISFASTKFRDEAGEAVRRAVEHIEEKYGDRIVAYVPGGGPCGEWFHWDYGRSQQSVSDYSECMQEAYRAYLKKKYAAVDALNQSWGAEYGAFGDVPLPDHDARFSATHTTLRAAGREQSVIDYYEVHNRVLADTLIHWAAKAKEGCRGDKVVMVFYGYLYNHEGVALMRSGHIHLDDVLRSPHVDCIVAPCHYSFRQLDGVMSGQGVVGSPIRRGKQYLHELDGSTCLQKCWPCPDHHNPENAAETGELFRRELGKVLTEGSIAWYMDLGGGYYDREDVVEELRKTLEVGRTVRPHAGRNNRQVAVVLHARSNYYFREGDVLPSALVSMFKQFELERMGLDYDDLIVEDLRDLSLEETEQYKVWIFPCALFLEDAEVDWIRRHACRNGNHVIWNYGVDVCHGQDLALDRMESITGFRCGANREPGEIAVTVRANGHPFTEGLPKEIRYGTYGDLSPDMIKYHAALGKYPTSNEGFRVAPRFYLEPGEGQTLGRLGDLPGSPPGLAVKPMDGWVSVLSVAPLLPRAILRNIARAAGCHVYTDFPGQVCHCEGLFGMFFHDTGPCRIRFPARGRITDVHKNRVWAEDADEIEVAAKRNTSILLQHSADA